ncbi:MAG: hypothetical protein QOD94_2234 [Alphaproteobacteria bacterium]|nr:hypothetical protein [Alphaproteobacteria bacterium]
MATFQIGRFLVSHTVLQCLGHTVAKYGAQTDLLV